jgi:hypothetical protein
MSYLFEYLSEFKFTFTTNLRYKSGDLVGIFDKKTEVKIHASVPLEGICTACLLGKYSYKSQFSAPTYIVLFITRK